MKEKTRWILLPAVLVATLGVCTLAYGILRGGDGQAAAMKTVNPADYTPKLYRDAACTGGVSLDYADANKIIFHGSFGLFVYDLRQECMTASVDIAAAIGDGEPQEALLASVQVSRDGGRVQLYKSGPEGRPPETAFLLDTVTRSLKAGPFRAWKNTFQAQTGSAEQLTVSCRESLVSNVILLDTSAGCITCGDGTIGSLTYWQGSRSWRLFA